MNHELVHVYPVNDLKPHDTDTPYCACGPRIEDGVVVHNSWDGREILERAVEQGALARN